MRGVHPRLGSSPTSRLKSSGCCAGRQAQGERHSLLHVIALCSLADEFRSSLDASNASQGSLWAGPHPSSSYSPEAVISLTLEALQRNNDPQPHAGTALLRRFSTPTFTLAGEPIPASGSRVSPQALSSFFSTSQYGLLLNNSVVVTFPTEICSFDEGSAWQEVVLESPGGSMLAKLGWSLTRSGGCWLTSEVMWHDFRDGWRPGIGQVEWDRSFG